MGKKTSIEQAVEQFLEHAHEEHVLGKRNGYNEFAEFGIEVTDNPSEQFRDFIHKTLNDPETRAFITSKDGSHLNFYNDRDNIFIAIEPQKGGTVYRPDLEKYPNFFDDKLTSWKEELGDNFLEVRSGGFPALNDAYVEKFGHLPKIGPLARLGQIFDEAIGNIPRPFTRTFKILPFVGTAITFAASEAEAAELREAAYQAITDGLLPESALDDYESVILGHQIQVNFDPTMVYGESATQADYEKFIDRYSAYFEAHPELEDMLKPPSLLGDIQNEMTNDMAGRPFGLMLELPVAP